MFKFTISLFFLLLFYSSKGQYKSVRINNDNKFYYKKTNINFATYDEILVNDSIITGLIVKDLRGQILATVLYKIGKDISDSVVSNVSLKPYTEIYFTKNIIACQIQNFTCKEDLKNVFENLLYDEENNNTSKSSNLKYEIDYSKVDVFAENNGIIYTELIEETYNPISDNNRIIRFTIENNTCNKKLMPKSNIKKQPYRK